MSDITMTIFGYVGSEVEFRDGHGTGDRAVFRVACTPRYYDRARGTWRDQETVWMTVKAWRVLAQNVASSIHKGDPVVVIGKVRAQVWTDADGEQHRRDVVEAMTVCHDLSRGTSAFRKSERLPERVDDADDVGAMIADVERSSAGAERSSTAQSRVDGEPVSSEPTARAAAPERAA